jgi:hypothetical protein
VPTLVVEGVPGEIYERLERRARAQNRSLSEEAVRLLQQGLGREGAAPADASGGPPTGGWPLRDPDPPAVSEETGAPCDLPRPGEAVQVPAIEGADRLPDPPSSLDRAS